MRKTCFFAFCKFCKLAYLMGGCVSLRSDITHFVLMIHALLTQILKYCLCAIFVCVLSVCAIFAFFFLWSIRQKQGCTSFASLAAWLWETGEWMRKWRGNGERMRKWREIHFLHFLLFSLFPPSLSISFTKNCLTLMQDVKYGTFVANVTKNLTYYALWEINLRSTSQRESSAGCEGLHSITFYQNDVLCIARLKWKLENNSQVPPPAGGHPSPPIESPPK